MSTIAITKSGKAQLGLAVIVLFLLPIITVTLSLFEAVIVNNQIANILIYALPFIGIYIWLLAAKGLPLNKCGKIGLTFLLVAKILALLNNIWYIYLQDYSFEYYLSENTQQLSTIYAIAHNAIDILIFIPGVILFYFGSRLPVATKILAVTTSIIFVLWGLSQGLLWKLFCEMGDILFVYKMILSLNLTIRILLFIPIIIVTLVWMSRNDYQSAEHSCDAA